MVFMRMIRYVQFHIGRGWAYHPEQVALIGFAVVVVPAIYYTRMMKQYYFDPYRAQTWYTDRFTVLRPDDPRTKYLRPSDEYPPWFVSLRDNNDIHNPDAEY